MTDSRIEKAKGAAEALRQRIADSVVGYDSIVDELLVSFMARGHLLLEGVPGIAKTTLAKAFARALGLSFSRVQFAPDVLPADVTGHTFYSQKTQEFETRKGPVFANVVLGDEINRAGAKTQASLLEAMQEHQVTIEGTTHPLPDPFFTIATQNPVDVEGVYTLPIAQLDRFMLRSRMDYLPREAERAVLQAKADGTLADPDTSAKSKAAALTLRGAHEAVHVDGTLLDYVLDLVTATRKDERLRLGASTRAADHLLQATRAHAVLQGREYAVPDDVKRVAPAVLAHRLFLTVDAELEGATAGDVLADILRTVPVPLETPAAPSARNPGDSAGPEEAKPPPVRGERRSPLGPREPSLPAARRAEVRG